MEQIKLDLIPGRINPICHACQYDVGRVIRINLMNGYSTAYTLDGTETVTLNVRKVDGNMVTEELTATSGNTYVDFSTTQQMTACYGSNLCNLTIEKNGTLIGTLTFILEVQRDPLDGSLSSASEIENLTAQVYAIVQEQYDGDVIFDETPNPDHAMPYTVTSRGIAAALGNIDVNELHDVDISSPTNNQVLKYDATTQKWVNGPDVGAIDLNDIRDVDIDSTTLANGDALVYDSTEDKWINAEAGKKTLAELNDVVITNPQRDDCIVYDPTTQKWVNGEGGGKVWEGTKAQYDALSSHDPDTIYYITDGTGNQYELADIADVTISNPTDGQSLVYDASNDVWVNGDPTISYNLEDCSDVAISSVADGQILGYNGTSGKWVNTGVATNTTIAKGSNMPSDFPIPVINRRGNIVTIMFGLQLPTGTYASTDALWTVSPLPIAIQRCILAMGSQFPNMLVDTSGNIRFNSNQTLTSDTWLIGQFIYLTDG